MKEKFYIYHFYEDYQTYTSLRAALSDLIAAVGSNEMTRFGKDNISVVRKDGTRDCYCLCRIEESA